MNLGFWLRWSWRDLQSRWLQVVGIALIIAFGTGVFAGLDGQKTWRKNSYDLSYGKLHMYDLQMQLASGSYLNQADVQAALQGISGVQTIETRLVTPTLVDASTADQTIIVRGEIIGMDVSDGGPHVNGVYVEDGRALTEADSGKNVVIVEYKFAKHYDLKPGSPIRISGGTALDFVGAGHSPEYFMVMPDTGSFWGQSSFAALFVPLETAQNLAGREKLVNEAVFLLEKDADEQSVQAEIETRMAAAFPQTGIEISSRQEDEIYNMLYTDAEGDQTTWNTIALLFLLGAALGAFNLAGRMVEAQRRQIGIGMALGVPRLWIALRPMLVGVQIAVLGTIFGLLVGVGLNQLFAKALKDLVPMPYWDISFYLPGYLKATFFGITLPFLATLIPVWRAVRVAPVDAITSGYLVAKGGGLSKLSALLPLPGRSFSQMPIKNILRSPWRTSFTIVGIAIAIMLMTVMVGAGDSYAATMQRAEDAYLHRSEHRVLVNLDFFYPVEAVTYLTSLTNKYGQPLFKDTETSLLVGGTLTNGEETLDVLLELHEMDSALWTPRLLEGKNGGLILSEKAADDLGVQVGDNLTLKHPLREGEMNFRLVETVMPVAGIHDNPLRPLAYMDMDAANTMGLAGTTNLLVVDPAAGVSVEEIQRALMSQPGVTSVRPISDFSDAVEELLSLITAMLLIVEAVVVGMSFLIAFNSTSISVDERVREIATMFAFGLRLRTVTRMQMVENLVIGILGTLLGIALGWAVLNLIMFSRADIEMPDIKFDVTLSLPTMLLAGLLGVLVVALTPLFSLRRMQHLDIPSTLRVME